MGPTYIPGMPILVLFPMLQIARTFSGVKPFSLHCTIICEPESSIWSVGDAPTGYSLSSAFCSSSRTKCAALEYRSSLRLQCFRQACAFRLDDHVPTTRVLEVLLEVADGGLGLHIGYVEVQTVIATDILYQVHGEVEYSGLIGTEEPCEMQTSNLYGLQRELRPASEDARIR